MSTYDGSVLVKIYSDHLDLDHGRDIATDAEWADLSQRISAALEDKYPQAEIEVEIKHGVCGVGSGTFADDRDIQEYAAILVDRVRSEWIHALHPTTRGISAE